ncbi:MAG: hypothetical protein IPK28_08290 [Devosia sp.]|nr:hypothetical protein [Devosia sp.]
MSARIAPEPISAAVGSAVNYRSRPATSDSAPQQQSDHTATNAAAPPAQHALPIKEAPPPPPPPPGAAFAVALISGQLPPRPTSEREIVMRLGSADLPSQGSLALHDRLV